MDIKLLYQNLGQIESDGTFFDRLEEVAAAYYTDAVKLSGARTTFQPTIQLTEQVEGRYLELRGIVEEINHALGSHNPPLPAISLEKRDLNGLVSDIARNIVRKRS